MNQKEIRMRCIEALSSMGVREPQRLISDAKQLEEWISAAEDKPEAPRRGPKPKTDG
jgi:hypothetical protein